MSVSIRKKTAAMWALTGREPQEASRVKSLTVSDAPGEHHCQAWGLGLRASGSKTTCMPDGE